MELVATGNVLATFLAMSNELGTPKILHCPEDTDRVETNSFAALASSNISYFVNVDATESYPQMFLCGDDNFAVDGVPVKSGLLEITTNTQCLRLPRGTNSQAISALPTAALDK